MKILHKIKVLALLLVCISSALQINAQCSSFEVNIIQDDDCNSNGIIDVVYTHPYSINVQYPNNNSTTLSSTQDTIKLTDLYGGSYTITLDDPLACSESVTLTAVELTANIFSPFFTTNGYNVSCNGECDATIYFTLINPQDTYTIDWYKDTILGTPFFSTNNVGTTIRPNLCAGEYHFLLTSGSNCESVRTFELREPDTLLVEGVTTEVLCNGESIGSIEIEVSGGVGDAINSNTGNVVSTEDYSFSWSSPTGFNSTDEDISGLEGGLYSVIVTDDNNCTYEKSFNVVDTISPLVVNFVSQDSVTCWGMSNGGLQVSASGARGPYEFRVDGQTWQSSGQFDNLSAGNHVFDAKDSNGCIGSQSFEVLSYPKININLLSLDIIQCKDSLGSFEVQATGGKSPFNYIINAPQESGLFEGLEADSYIVFAEDKFACVRDTTIVVGDIPFLSVDISSKDLSCFNSSDGEISVTSSLGTAPYNISVDTLSITSASNYDVSNLSAGFYDINVTDNSGCPFDTTIQLFQPEEIVISVADSSKVSCFGLQDGSIAISYTGGQGNLTYQWVKDGFPMFIDTNTVTNLEAGSYTINAYDDSTCFSQNLDVVINQPTQIILSLDSLNNPLCNGVNDGYIHLSAVGGSIPYSFDWTGDTIASIDKLNDLAAGNYEVIVSDFKNCKDTLDFILNDPQQMSFNSLVTNVNCFGESTGQINVEVLGGLAPYSITTSSPFGTTTSSSNNDLLLQGIPQGQYTFTSTDSNLCVYSETFDISENTEMQATFSNIVSETCDADNAEVSVNVSGGTPQYNYNWVQSAQSSSTAIAISGGENKFVQVTDSLNCSKEFMVFIPKILTVNIDSINVINNFCAGDSDGQIEINSSGTSYPLTYNLSGVGDFESSDTTFVITNLLSDDYILVVTDSNGCTDSWTPISITENDSISFLIDSTITTSKLSCFGDDNGKIYLDISGGLPFPGDYYWLFVNDPDFSQQISTDSIAGLPAGSYNLSVQDANGCLNSLSYEITEPQPISVVSVLTPTSCNGASDGEAIVVVSGGTSNFTLSSNTSAVTITPLSTDTFKFSGLSEGMYFYDIVDAKSCNKLNNSFYISEPSKLEISNISSTLESCLGFDATASVSVTGGTSPYSYLWSYDDDFQLPVQLENNTLNITANNAHVENLTSGWYYVHVWDYNSCYTLDSIYVTQNNRPILSLIGTVNNLCHNEEQGQISLSAINGNPFYEYSLNGGLNWQYQSTFSGLSEGFYNATVRDSLGCTDELEDIEISAPLPISVDVNAINVSCVGSSDGTASVISTSGGTPSTSGYSYSWKNENGTNLWPGNSSGVNPTVNNLFPGSYQLEVEDNNGCTTTYFPVIINEPLDVSLDLSILSSYNGTDISCFGYSDGIILANANGGTGTYTFEWFITGQDDDIRTNSSSGFDTLSLVSQGNYTVHVRDSRGCQAEEEITINHPDKIEVDFEDVIHIRCEGNSDGKATALFTGGLGFGNYSVSWTNELNNIISLSADVTNLSAGTYYATYTDNNGCFGIDSITIDYSELFTLTNTSDTTSVSCLGSIDGSFNFNAVGGWLPYSYDWNDPLNQQSATAVGLAPNMWYTNIITDAEGCILIDSVFVDSPIDLVEISTFEVVDNDCYGQNIGSINVEVIGGTPDYDFQWSGPGSDATSEDISGLVKGTYNLVITDQAGCELTASYIVEGPDNPLLINSVITTDVSCNGLADGTANITNQISGGTSPYINEDWDGENPNILSSGTYTIEVTDNNGCKSSVEYTIFEPDAYSVTLDVVDEYCEGQDGNILVQASGGTPFDNGYYNYFIEPISAISPDLTYQSSSQNNANIVVDFPTDNDVSDTLFMLTIKDDNGCVYTQEVEIHPARVFNYNHVINVCFGDTIVLEGSQFADYSTYSWSISPLQDANQDESNLSLVVRNSSTISVEVTDYASPCSFIDELNIVVLKPVISADEDFGIIRGESANLSITDGEPPFLWSNSETTSEIVVSPLITTNYVAYALDTLTGCIGNDTVRVFVGMNEGFSPNNDGYNDTWEISYLNQYESAKIEIFNRWGSSLWSSSYPNIENWDGKYNGNDLPIGTYYYIISFDNSLNKEPLTGPVTIVR